MTLNLKDQRKLIQQLATQYCKLKGHSSFGTYYLVRLFNTIYKEFGKELITKNDLSEYYDFAIQQLQKMNENLRKKNIDKKLDIIEKIK